MVMNEAQLAFLEQMGERIPLLFDAIAKGNVKSEFIIGVRTINSRPVRLKLVAEVVDPGSNPLATHGQVRPSHSDMPSTSTDEADVAAGGASTTAGSACSGAVNSSEVSKPPAGRRRTRRR